MLIQNTDISIIQNTDVSIIQMQSRGEHLQGYNAYRLGGMKIMLISGITGKTMT